MKGNRLDVKDPVESVRSFSACLFSQEGYRVAFIEQAKLAFRQAERLPTGSRF